MKKPTVEVNFPIKEQGIVLSVIEDATNDYLAALKTIVAPVQVIFASRMSKGRYCIYFDSKEIANSFTMEHGKLTVLGKDITARPLMNPAKRVLLSNVCPIIPHSIIENALNNLLLDIKLTSSIQFVKASSSHNEFKHVLSFRRAVFYTTDIDSIYIHPNPSKSTMKMKIIAFC